MTAHIDLDGTPEDATPPKPQDAPQTRRAAKPSQRTLPHSQEAEEHVIACCLLEGDDGDTVERALESGITPASFYSPDNRRLFEIICGLHAKGVSPTLETLVAEFQSLKWQPSGGMPYLMQVTAKVPTTVHAGYFIEKVREKHTLRELIKTATGTIEQAHNFSGDLDELLSSVSSSISAVTSQDGGTTATPKPITSYRYPADEDPNILLGKDDYLGRGGGMLFVSHAGAGKSSWIMDACMMWALGRPWMGIRCARPLRSLIIQAEDSDRYIGKIFTSFAHVNKLTPEQTKQLGENCIIIREKGTTGETFNRLLRKLTKKHKPDLVVINPIYLYAEGDITKSEYAQPFLVGLDKVNKDEKFAYILIHHTGKPAAKGKDGQRATLDDWESAYMGFGSSYFANWPRCTALLEPVPETQGRFVVKLGKGGLNAGVTKEVDQGVGKRTEPVTRIPIRHSTARMIVDGAERPVYYWEADDAPLPQAAKNPVGAGRKRMWTFEDLEHVLPLGKDRAEGWRSMMRKAKEAAPSLSNGSFEIFIMEATDRGLLVKDKTDPRQPKYYRPLPEQPGRDS